MLFAHSGRVSALSDSFCSVKSDPGKNFATQRWNLILGVFYEQMPLKRHWKLLWPYDNSFTGKEAVDFLLRVLPKLIINNQIYRLNCFLLLQKFMKKKLIFNPRNTQDTEFHDDGSIYRFNSERVLKELRRTADSSLMNTSFPYFCPPKHASYENITSEEEPSFFSRSSSFRLPSFRKPRRFFSSFCQPKAPPIFVPPPPPTSNPPPVETQQIPIYQEMSLCHRQLYRKRSFQGSDSSIPHKLLRTSF
ncbi:hypothetical protein FO519_003217 [Halicephalobus sp. NKZ332]|nr:hypothetical protein FO519_003217 [Halicephalobus sp. NKZ332]